MAPLSQDLARCRGGGSSMEIPQDGIQALDVVLRHSTIMSAVSDRRCMPLARAIFYSEVDGRKNTPSLGGGAEIWFGYQQSLRPAEGSLMLNIDLAAAAFVSAQPALDFVYQAAGADARMPGTFHGQQQRKASKAITGIKVYTNHLGSKRSHKVKGLSEQGAEGEFFEQDGRTVSVAEYFGTKYGRLRYPGAVCLNVGSSRRPRLIPVELATVCEGQRKQKLDGPQTAKMVQESARGPTDQQQLISDFRMKLSMLQNDPTCHAFKVKPAETPTVVDGHVLEAPGLEYAQGREEHPRQGAWNLQGKQFKEAAAFGPYAIAAFGNEHHLANQLQDFMCGRLGMLDALHKLGFKEEAGWEGCMAPDRMPPVVWHDPSQRHPGETIEMAVQACKHCYKMQGTEKPCLIFVLLETNAAELYKEVKRATDSYQGIPSQCFVADKAGIAGRPKQGNARAQYCANLAMKINAKLGGRNWSLLRQCEIPSIASEPFMVLGADVSHPTGFSNSEPSIAAVVGSMDAGIAQYAAQVALQPHRLEVIQDMRTMVKKLVVHFAERLKVRFGRTVWPVRVIVYRDGVSEGQFHEVLKKEVPQIAAAFREIMEQDRPEVDRMKAMPALTFIVVQKRHHTRLYPTDSHNVDSPQSGNVQPGTVVDTTITAPHYFNWFMTSHAGIAMRGRGTTTRPAHYTVLVDSSKLSMQDLQNFTYGLCYLFCRATRAVSVPAPVYYAHLAAFRARAHTTYGDSSASESSVDGQSVTVEHAEVGDALRQKMYYI
ncbi:hypothetical protein WJX84_011569 [Apatococcus fuscideae]|uniref:Piwi domain-containing protein n=1 Tax=Apatococcus fuscideae TaxID=2026836 RepID=A0AAW1SQ88_9CHLO